VLHVPNIYVKIHANNTSLTVQAITGFLDDITNNYIWMLKEEAFCFYQKKLLERGRLEQISDNFSFEIDTAAFGKNYKSMLEGFLPSIVKEGVKDTQGTFWSPNVVIAAGIAG